jgi:predicted GNAT family acetyltransferase
MTSEIALKLEGNGKGAFVIEEAGERVAEMEIGIAGKNLTAYHTEVSEKLKGKGVAARLLSAMLDYAREHHLKVIALCPYVSIQFQRNQELYKDIWNRDWHKQGSSK